MPSVKSITLSPLRCRRCGTTVVWDTDLDGSAPVLTCACNTVQWECGDGEKPEEKATSVTVVVPNDSL